MERFRRTRWTIVQFFNGGCQGGFAIGVRKSNSLHIRCTSATRPCVFIETYLCQSIYVTLNKFQPMPSQHHTRPSERRLQTMQLTSTWQLIDHARTRNRYQTIIQAHGASMTENTIFNVHPDGTLARMRPGAPASEDHMQALVAR